MHELKVSASLSRNELMKQVEEWINASGFNITDKDHDRPWGGFFVLQEDQAASFIDAFFPGYTLEQLMLGEKLSPKILVVAPNKRLSWQYHFRRAEIWRVVAGPVKVSISENDEEITPLTYNEGDVIVLQKGQRHRLIGAADTYGVVAEIWQHTEATSPSDEDDIIRLQDDFGRSPL